MYTAFAEGNTPLLHQICCDGLYDSLKSKIIARGQNKMIWRMEGLVGAPKLVSSNALYIGDLGMGFRQAVVKIRSLQIVYRYDCREKQCRWWNIWCYRSGRRRAGTGVGRFGGRRRRPLSRYCNIGRTPPLSS
ncbi:hypothetical protein BGX38DRAFT_1215 [Terfezia claveryi]|nr:hypothetical protein BGX38DRAFT_1215 [Terfezia claveryi]